MATSEIPVKIQDDPHTRQEQFREIEPEIEFGNQGTLRLQNYSFKDGEAVYLNVGNTEVRRDAGFHKPLFISNPNQKTRVYHFRGVQWYRETTSPDVSMNSLQRRVGQFGFWVGLHEWLNDVGDVISGITYYLLAPLVVIPALTLQLIEFLFGLFCVVVFSIAIWKLILASVANLLFG